MGRFMVLAVLGCTAFAQSPLSADSKPATASGEQASVYTATSILPDLPPLPQGKATVIGGAIRNLDLVRDQLTVYVFGGHDMKVLFDERTQVYRDGVHASLRDLQNGNHVSLETVLDGTTIFARSIHMLTQLSEGECQGQVLNYNPGNGELIVRDILSREPIKLRVPANTAIVREGQAASSSANLGPGTLVSVKFQPDNSGHGVASRIAILANPGTSFVFSGNVAFLDMHSGLLVLIDPRDNRRYEILFDPAQSPINRNVHEGTNVSVTTDFDGIHYSARVVTMNPASGK
jgi:hypothetical protein